MKQSTESLFSQIILSCESGWLVYISPCDSFCYHATNSHSPSRL